MKRALWAGLLSATALVMSVPVRADSLEDGFAHPSMEAKPRLRWWWPGAAVADEELRRELKLMADNGFAGGEIQAMTPSFVTLTSEEKAVVNDYAEPSFFAHVRAAGEAAKALGLSLDYTLGSAWPSGGGVAIPPEKAFTELAMARTQVQGGTASPIKVDIPKRTRRLGALNFLDARVKAPEFADWGKRLDARALIVAVVAMTGGAPELKGGGAAPMGFTISPWKDVETPGTLDPSSRIVLTDRLREDGTLDWTPPPGQWQVFVFKQYASDVGVLGAAGRGPQLILDHMDPTAFAAHAARVGDPLGKNPAGIRSTFVDSLELMQDIQWGPQFLTEFRKRRGYDLTPYLPFVVQPGWMQAWDEHWSPPYFNAADGEIADRVRADYRRTVSDLMFAGFVEPFVAWNHAHGLKAKFQAHGGALDIIRGYGLVDIPETEDLLHGGDPLVMRFARSGAHLYGRKLVSAESLVWKDRAYEVTPDEMRRRVDLLMAGGVNSMILHGMNYRFHADDWPGWHAFQPSPFAGGFSTMFNESNPIWPAVKPLAAYIARLQSVMQAGEAVVPVAYFYGRTGYYVGIEDDGAGAQAAEKALLAGGYDFDRINPDSIANARVEKRQLVSKGGQRYPVLALPPLDAIRADTAEKIAAFAKAGLPVFFSGRAPGRDEGLANREWRDARVKAAVAAALRAGAKIVPEGEMVAALRTAAIPANLTFTGDATDLVYVQRRFEGRTVTFLHNRGDVARSVSLALPQPGRISRWNAMDGSMDVVAARGADAASLALILAPGESALLILDPKAAPVAPGVPQSVGRLSIPADGWLLRVEGHAVRKAYAHDFGRVTLGDWRDVPELAGFAGTATYRRNIHVDAGWLSEGTKVAIDLGQLHDMATVTVNGRVLPPSISAPYRVDLTGALRSGANDLAVTIANVPQNAMIDPKDPTYKKLKPVAAGWVGPVALEAVR
ncbi:glycosyl hydrolase [Sphingobium sp.]|uniref:glycosyl hydrolase n=1 Tax=Sphingobium sp. TaxID=1912891 RepID=UPI002C4541D0|nr:glycosyl hydrolase [Sphingobium sp.]HUD90894.1 glycosyl hydrolase [Sphingobium sp.]